jgi:hypothetical protein
LQTLCVEDQAHGTLRHEANDAERRRRDSHAEREGVS